MAKFIYKMQSLLNIKEKLEEQEKTAYGLAKATLNEEERRLAEFVAKKNRYIEEKRVEMSSSIHVQELTLLEHAIKSMEYRVEEQVLVVKRAEREVMLAQARLEHAMKERKIQENQETDTIMELVWF